MSKFNFKKLPWSKKKIKTENIFINSALPAKGTDKFFKDLSNLESRSMHGQLPIVWKKAENFNIYDIKNNKFIDFTSGIFISNIGHSNKNLIKNLKKLFDNNLLSCYSYLNSPRKEYLKSLIEYSKLKNYKAFLVSSGTEATEAALKIMRMYGLKKNKNIIIAFEGNWHGRTLGAQMMSGNLSQKSWIKNLDKDIVHLPFPYPWEVSEKNSLEFFEKSLEILKKRNINFDSIAGIIVETFQGWCAAFYPKKYIKLLKEFSTKHNICLTFDEMQAGFSRTGKNFGFQHYQVKPDLICIGKGMGGGVPLSGLIGRSDLLDLPETGSMSSTHSANPLVCTAGLTVIKELTSKKLTKKSELFGKYIKPTLKKLQKKYPKFITGIYGEGMIFAIVFNNQNFKNKNHDCNYLVSQICENIMFSGLLVVHTGRESIKIGPPLTITKSALKEGLNIIVDQIDRSISQL